MAGYRAAGVAMIGVPAYLGVFMVVMPFLVLGAAGGASSLPPGQVLCSAGGTGGTVAGVRLDAEQMASASAIVSVTAGRHLPSFAAVVAVDTAYTESTLHNYTTQSDHDSEGLFQQRVSIYTKEVADDTVKATNAFLDRLVQVPDWRDRTAGDDAQTVQGSRHPERYPPNVPLAEALVGQFWSADSAAAGPTPSTSASSDSPAPAPAVPSGQPVCAGGGGVGPVVGPTGNNVAGTTTIPAGFVISGTRKGQTAVRYALGQLGKPYVFAATGPDAFDCSGLTMAAWAAAGVALPHLASAQGGMGTPEPTNLSQAVGGDLVLIPGSDGTPQAPGHIGMVAGYVDKHDDRHLYIIQAPMTGIPIELTEATQWTGQVVGVRHIA
jgi:cell wall-associated NlpC family hydrolase